MKVDPREELLRLWLDFDPGTGELSPPDLSSIKLKGAVGRRYRLLWYSFQASKRKIYEKLKSGWKKTPRSSLIILSLAMEELIWKDFKECHGVLSSWGNICKTSFGAERLPLVNAILRSLLRDAKEKNWTSADFLPVSLKKVWSDSGKNPNELPPLLDTPIKIYWHPVSDHEGADFLKEDIPWKGGSCFFLEKGTDPRMIAQQKEFPGFFQNVSAAEISRQVHEEHKGVLLDYCAAPGGKSWQISRLSDGQAKIHAWDSNPERVQLMKSNPLMNRYSKIEILDEPPLAQKYESILLDVPCSNSGVLVKCPEAIRHFWKTGDDFKAIQEELLSRATECLKPGGKLFYSTCSVDPVENQKRVTEFSKSFPFQLKGEHLVWPEKTGSHGAYLAILQKDVT